jgi:uncharacterized protein (TIGR03032 family)
LAAPARIESSLSGAFGQWLADSGGSLAVTTYQAGKVAMIGWDGQQVSVLLRHFEKPLGLAVQNDRIALATRHAILLFANASLLAHDFLEEAPGRYDGLFLPRAAYYTGDINAHDLAFASDGLWIVNTRFCCLARPSAEYSFVPVWKPPFVSDIVPEDRCHLNGLAVVDGKPKYVTALGETDTVGGWRDNKAAGGVIVDIESNQVVLRGLSMPHSPRWYRGQLWVLNSGAGELWVVDPKQGRHLVVCSLPGYLRGLAFAGQFALIGLCQIREKHIFGGLPVQQRHEKLLCGVAIVDLLSGRQVGMLEFTAGAQELYEVQFLPGLRRPMILNHDNEPASQAFTAPQFSYWLRPSNEIRDNPDRSESDSPSPGL